jgi:hypothetical protein
VYITAFFTQDFAPKTGLSAQVSVLRLSDNALVVTAQAMTESNLAGYYYYNWGAYDDGEEYVIVADGGSSLNAVERYKHNGSADGDIKPILEDTDQIQGKLPANGIADESLQQAAHTQTQTDIADLENLSQTQAQTAAEAAFASQGYTPTRAANLDNLDDSISNVRNDIAGISNVTRFACTIPILERPDAGSIAYKIRVNLVDTDGQMEDPDANTVNVGAENHAGMDRSSNLGGGGVMSRLAQGRYEITYTVSSTDALEQLIFTFSYAENAEPFAYDRSQLVVDTSLVGYTAADRTRDVQIASETAAIDGRLPADPATVTNQAAILTAIGDLEDLSQAQAQAACAAALAALNFTASSGTELNWLYQRFLNQLDLAASGKWVLQLEGGGKTTWDPVLDYKGDPIILQPGAPARRPKGVIS